MDIDQILREALTDEQYAAATDSAREVLCLACAGSGKSRTLAYRIARLLAEGELPESIVAFTFTEKAAESIKRRVKDALEAAGIPATVIGAMYIGTIHAYCQSILGTMDARYRQYDVLDDNRLKLYLIRNYGLLGIHQMRDRMKARYFKAVAQVSDAWKTANDEMLDFAGVVRSDSDAEPNIGDMLVNIGNRMKQDEVIDFSAMIRFAVELIEEGAPGTDMAIGGLRHLMVDEYQDVNPSQEALISLLNRRCSSLLVVGDDDQAIYGWRGADVTNILEFEERYPGCTVHTLSENFRSTEPIVTAADVFVTQELGPERIEKNPTASRNPSPQDVRVLLFPNRPAEAEWVARRINALLSTEYEESDGTIRGLTPADFAVLMRSTGTDEQDGSPRHTAFTTALDDLGIKYSLESGGGPFDRPQAEVLRNTFALLQDGNPGRAAVRQHFNESVLTAYPNADFNALVRVLGEWGRRIHQPDDSASVRLYPQELVYQLLAAYNVSHSDFDDDTMRNIGLFSRMILDIETVFPHVGAGWDFWNAVNFLNNLADSGYDVSTDDVLQRPDAVTVSTVHKMKGLEFPCVFVVDAEQGRFPGSSSKYSGWLPAAPMADAISRGSYQSTTACDVRLFYTAVTRAERYLYVTGAKRLPAAKSDRKLSSYALRLSKHNAVLDTPEDLPAGLTLAMPDRRVEDPEYPTNFSEIKHYLDCPKSYQFSRRYGFNPVIQAMFGYGKSVHTSIQKLHELYPNAQPRPAEIESAVSETFHLRHVAQSRDPENNPGPYERAEASAVRAAQAYVESHGSDFERQRATEVTFEIPAADCVISGSIDLLLKEDEAGNILGAEIIDFKTMDSGDPDDDKFVVDWTELALQVQLYAKAAVEVLGENARTGSVHFLKDNQRVNVSITDDALDAAIANIEWAVQGILASDFPMRPHPEKCDACDFKAICAKVPQDFSKLTTQPPALHIPDGRETARAFSQYRPAT